MSILRWKLDLQNIQILDSIYKFNDEDVLVLITRNKKGVGVLECNIKHESLKLDSCKSKQNLLGLDIEFHVDGEVLICTAAWLPLGDLRVVCLSKNQRYTLSYFTMGFISVRQSSVLERALDDPTVDLKTKRVKETLYTACSTNMPYSYSYFAIYQDNKLLTISITYEQNEQVMYDKVYDVLKTKRLYITCNYSGRNSTFLLDYGSDKKELFQCTPQDYKVLCTQKQFTYNSNIEKEFTIIQNNLFFYDTTKGYAILNLIDISNIKLHKISRDKDVAIKPISTSAAIAVIFLGNSLEVKADLIINTSPINIKSLDGLTTDIDNVQGPLFCVFRDPKYIVAIRYPTHELWEYRSKLVSYDNIMLNVVGNCDSCPYHFFQEATDLLEMSNSKLIRYFSQNIGIGEIINTDKWTQLIVKELSELDSDMILYLDGRELIIALLAILSAGRGNQNFPSKSSTDNLIPFTNQRYNVMYIGGSDINVQMSTVSVITVGDENWENSRSRTISNYLAALSFASAYDMDEKDNLDLSCLTKQDKFIPNCLMAIGNIIGGSYCSNSDLDIRYGCDIPLKILIDGKSMHTGIFIQIPALFRIKNDYEIFVQGLYELLNFVTFDLQKLSDYSSLFGGSSMLKHATDLLLKMQKKIKAVQENKENLLIYYGGKHNAAESGCDTPNTNAYATKSISKGKIMYLALCDLSPLWYNNPVKPTKVYTQNSDAPWVHLIFHELTHDIVDSLDKKATDDGTRDMEVYGLEKCCENSRDMNERLIVTSSPESLPIIADCLTFFAMFAYYGIVYKCNGITNTRTFNTQQTDGGNMIFDNDIKCNMNARITTNDVYLQYFVTNSLSQDITLSHRALLLDDIGRYTLKITGPMHYECRISHNTNSNGIIINAGGFHLTTISLSDSCYFSKNSAPPGEYIVSVNMFAKVIVDVSGQHDEIPRSDLRHTTHLNCATIIVVEDNLQGTHREHVYDL